MVECSAQTDGYRKTSNEEISTCSSRQFKYVPNESFPSLWTVSIPVSVSKASHNAVHFILKWQVDQGVSDDCLQRRNYEEDSGMSSYH